MPNQYQINVLLIFLNAFLRKTIFNLVIKSTFSPQETSNQSNINISKWFSSRSHLRSRNKIDFSPSKQHQINALSLFLNDFLVEAILNLVIKSTFPKQHQIYLLSIFSNDFLLEAILAFKWVKGVSECFSFAI